MYIIVYYLLDGGRGKREDCGCGLAVALCASAYAKASADKMAGQMRTEFGCRPGVTAYVCKDMGLKSPMNPHSGKSALPPSLKLWRDETFFDNLM